MIKAESLIVPAPFQRKIQVLPVWIMSIMFQKDLLTASELYTRKSHGSSSVSNKCTSTASSDYPTSDLETQRSCNKPESPIVLTQCKAE